MGEIVDELDGIDPRPIKQTPLVDNLTWYVAKQVIGNSGHGDMRIIKKALQQARNDGLEEAAKLMLDGTVLRGADEAANAIKALKIEEWRP